MNQLARVFVVINLLLAAGFMMAAATFLKQNDKWMQKHITLSKEFDTANQNHESELNARDAEIRRLKDDLQARGNEITVLKGEKTQLETRLESANQAKATAEQDKDREMGANRVHASAIEKVGDQLKQLEGLVDRYRTEMVTAQQERDQAVTARNTATQELESQKNETDDRDKKIALLMGDFAKTQATLASYMAIYPAPERADTPKIDGTVVYYNQGANVVEVNRGKTQGVSVGHRFDIVRGSEFICEVQVDTVSDNSSVGHITRIRMPNRDPQTGDVATRLESARVN